MTNLPFETFHKVIQGYRILDNGSGEVERFLRDASGCSACMHDPSDTPINQIVRALPLSRLRDRDSVERYFRRVRRDNGFLRNLFSSGSSPADVQSRLVSERFAIGLLPWLDYCMLYRRSRETEMMVIGIDFKNWPVFVKSPRDHYFPLDIANSSSNVWGSTWRRFWSNLLGSPYDEDRVVKFLHARAVYFTNSMLCFGGANDPRSHNWGYLERCRHHVERQLSIVRPRCLVSFGDFGARNVANILLSENRDCELLCELAYSRNPLNAFRRSQTKFLHLHWDGREIMYVPLYQPGWSHTAGYRNDYSALQDLLELKT